KIPTVAIQIHCVVCTGQRWSQSPADRAVFVKEDTGLPLLLQRGLHDDLAAHLRAHHPGEAIQLRGDVAWADSHDADARARLLLVDRQLQRVHVGRGFARAVRRERGQRRGRGGVDREGAGGRRDVDDRPVFVQQGLHRLGDRSGADNVHF
ncbi:unnamed protein product, partial [Mycena citricolor]